MQHSKKTENFINKKQENSTNLITKVYKKDINKRLKNIEKKRKKLKKR